MDSTGEIMLTQQVREVFEPDPCPKCKSEVVDIEWMNGDTGETGWICMKCDHEWTTKVQNS